MKTKKNLKKLSLKKNTISNLNINSMNSAMGGISVLCITVLCQDTVNEECPTCGYPTLADEDCGNTVYPCTGETCMCMSIEPAQ